MRLLFEIGLTWSNSSTMLCAHLSGEFII